MAFALEALVRNAGLLNSGSIIFLLTLALDFGLGCSLDSVTTASSSLVSTSCSRSVSSNVE